MLALDSKDGRIVVKGWREATRFTAEEVIQQLEPWCSGFLCTYVDKEGMMQGTDLDWFRRLRAATDLEITAAGGITTIEDIRALDSDGHPRRGRHGNLHRAAGSGRIEPSSSGSTFTRPLHIRSTEHVRVMYQSEGRMRVRSTVLFSCLLPVLGPARQRSGGPGSPVRGRRRFSAARDAYAKALRATPNDAEVVTGYAQILERYRDPAAREAWRKSAGPVESAGRTQDALHAARQAVLLDLIAGDRPAADADAAKYRDIGGS